MIAQFTPTSANGARLNLSDPRTAWQRVERYSCVYAVGVKAHLIHHAALERQPAWKPLKHASENFLSLSPNLHSLFHRTRGSADRPASLMICETGQDPARPGPAPEGCDVDDLAPVTPDAAPVAVAAFWKRLMEAWGAAAVSAPTPEPPSDEDVGTRWGEPCVSITGDDGGDTLMRRVNVSLWFKHEDAYDAAVQVGGRCSCVLLVGVLNSRLGSQRWCFCGRLRC